MTRPVGKWLFFPDLIAILSVFKRLPSIKALLKQLLITEKLASLQIPSVQPVDFASSLLEG